MNTAQTMAAIRALGLAVVRHDGEWRINHRGGSEDTAYYTTDNDDALGTAQLMAARPMPTDYAPYHKFPEFDQGITDYMEGRYDNPYSDLKQGVAAQAWDRGSEFAMRVVRYSNS
jgi:hypothetical protein